MDFNRESWIDASESLAFIGNSLLSPMSKTGRFGLSEEFWAVFPDFASGDVGHALERLGSFARAAARREAAGEDVVQRVSVEHAKLFVGPPKPAASPWETSWRGGGDVGFGEPTVQMRRLLRDAGLEVSNENNQYADHIGIEILFASKLCAQIAEAGSGSERLEAFLADHPLGWIGSLRGAVAQAAPDGYHDCLLELAEHVMRSVLGWCRAEARS